MNCLCYHNNYSSGLGFLDYFLVYGWLITVYYSCYCFTIHPKGKTLNLITPKKISINDDELIYVDLKKLTIIRFFSFEVWLFSKNSRQIHSRKKSICFTNRNIYIALFKFFVYFISAKAFIYKCINF